MVHCFVFFLKTFNLLERVVVEFDSPSSLTQFELSLFANLKFLYIPKLRSRLGQVNASHLKSSNLSHFASLVHALERLPGVVRVLQPFQSPSRPDSLVVDIVAGDGHLWVKVVARKGQALHLVWAGQGQFGERDLISQAEEYLECAKRHPHEFKTPQVVFVFYNQVTESMADVLEELGLTVLGERVSVAPEVQEKLSSCFTSDTEEDSTSYASDEDASYATNVSETCNATSASQEESRSPVITLTQSGRTFDRTIHFEHSSADNVLASIPTLADTWDTPMSFSATPSTHSDLDYRTFACPVVPDTSIKDLCPESPGRGQTVHLPACSFSNSHWAVSRPDIGASQTQSGHLSSSCPGKSIGDLFLHLVASPPAYETILPGASLFSNLRSCSPIHRVNLDITSLIALVSSVTNGNCRLVFRDKVLTQQAKEEQDCPILPLLTEFLKGKELFVCETALASFRSILDILGGEREKERAETFLSKAHIVKDQPSERSLTLPCQGRVKNRSKVIFGTGDTLQAVTVTSNMGFVRSAKSQGISFAVFLHQARALTEEKEKSASRLEDQVSA
ncbi:UPF0415 protein [Biomphalaria pfeifferi]|uniref:UPF0415 protein n=1 Tax=Biomphalaria pfeifferi TaxID=112525 RepID=A0AAD8B7L7_BIOPF|nr:UPF0415 protein [Biomphalaria pfeifferi]